MGDEACEHWLVQRRVHERYWACVDCEQEFRPVEPRRSADSAIGRRALLRMGLADPGGQNIS